MTDGWVVVDKPVRLTSTKIGSILKKILKIKKIGHVGTLDPLATGVLTFAIGNATKMIPYLSFDIKEYLFEIEFGEERSTDDAEGEIINSSNVIPSKEDVLKVIPEFIGPILQIPPMFSAIHINGKRAYKLAREGVSFNMEKRAVHIYDLTLIKEQKYFKVTCSKGTYIRSLGRDLALRLGTFGYIKTLRRTSDGIFSEKDANSLKNINIIPIDNVVGDMSIISVTKDEAKNLCLGKAISKIHKDGFCFVKQESQPICIALLKENLLYPKRILKTLI